MSFYRFHTHKLNELTFKESGILISEIWLCDVKEGNNIDEKTPDKCVHSYIAAIISQWMARGKVGKGIKYWYSSQKNLFRTLRRIHSVCKLFPLIYGTRIASCYSLNNKNISMHSLNSPGTLTSIFGSILLDCLNKI